MDDVSDKDIMHKTSLYVHQTPTLKFGKKSENYNRAFRECERMKDVCI